MRITVREACAMLDAHGVPNPQNVLVNPDVKDFGVPYFTGWKGMIVGEGCPAICSMLYILEPDDTVDIPDDARVECVGQWICFLKRGPSYVVAYVNIPSMDEGVIPAGSLLNIGDIRVNEHTPVEELDRLVKDGYDRLLAFIASEQSKAA